MRTGKARSEGTAGAGETRRVVVEGGEDAARVLVVDFEGIVDRLLAVPEPEEKDVTAIYAGADLIRAFIDGADDMEFGRAAPGLPPAASFTAQVLALTDEAFFGANAILGWDEWQPVHGERSREPLLSAVAEDITGEAFEAVAKSLLEAPGAEDPTIGPAFV